MDNKFILSHTVLYAKGWYKKTNDIWEDLKAILVLDGYQPDTKANILGILVYRFNDLKIHQTSLPEVLVGIHPNNCWKSNYITKEHCPISNAPDYDMPTAVVYYIMSVLRFLDKEHWDVVVPKYELYPRNPDITLKQVIDQFNKKQTP